MLIHTRMEELNLKTVFPLQKFNSNKIVIKKEGTTRNIRILIELNEEEIEQI